MSRVTKIFESSCEFCGGKSKAETNQAIRACTTCGAEVPDTVLFYSECDFLRSARRARSAAFGDVVESTVCFADPSETEDQRAEKAKKVKLAKQAEARRVKREDKARFARILEEYRWEVEIIEERERRAKLLNSSPPKPASPPPKLPSPPKPKVPSEEALRLLDPLSSFLHSLSLRSARRTVPVHLVPENRENAKLREDREEDENSDLSYLLDFSVDSEDSEDSNDSEYHVLIGLRERSVKKKFQTQKGLEFRPLLTHIAVHASWIQNGTSTDKAS